MRLCIALVGLAALLACGGHLFAQNVQPTTDQRLDQFDQRLKQLEEKYQADLKARDEKAAFAFIKAQQTNGSSEHLDAVPLPERANEGHDQCIRGDAQGLPQPRAVGFRISIRIEDSRIHAVRIPDNTFLRHASFDEFVGKDLRYGHDQVGIVCGPSLSPAVNFALHALEGFPNRRRIGRVDRVPEAMGQDADLFGQRA